MAKEKLTPSAPAEVDEFAPGQVQRLEQAQELATAQAEQTRALAMQLGYDGPLSVGALEDGIRFYQRRTVEALLETGKRLLLLKEVTPHGEFEGRVELLGFHIRTAQRFMRAAVKVAKNDTVSLLATQVKNQKAFLELVTHDDDEDIERVAELDNIDRMSASEMRAALRERDVQAKRQVAVIDELSREVVQLKLDRKVVAHTDWPDALLPVVEQVAAAGRKLAQGLSELAECRLAIFAAGHALAGDERASFEAALVHVAELYGSALARAERGLERERVTYDKTLGAFDDGAAAQAAQAVIGAAVAEGEVQA